MTLLAVMKFQVWHWVVIFLLIDCLIVLIWLAVSKYRYEERQAEKKRLEAEEARRRPPESR